MHTIKKLAIATAITTLSMGAAHAQVTEVEGAAGGGIVPWALLSGGMPTVSFTYVNSGEYNLNSLALNGSIAKMVELSYARQSFDASTAGLKKNITVDVIGAKVALHGMTGGWPALALGVQHKKANGSSTYDALLTSLGAKDSGTDVYLAATDVVPVAGKNVLLNGTLRYTKANQIGILGYGSATDNSRKVHFEGSVGVFVAKNAILGAEYRSKPDNISGLKEDAWWDIFYAYLPSKNLQITAAYANLGNIVASKDQTGLYLQVQANF